MEIKRYSKKRVAILESIRGTKEHPSAEWIYQCLKPNYPDLSLGTVYRNISQLKDAEQIVSVGVVNGHERYDATVSTHPHFICGNCGTVLDLDYIPMENHLKEIVLHHYRVKVDHFDLVFHGKCAQCIQKTESL
ncbi:MAG: Fur family transcriptional regulator [Christensenellales bacterium]